MNDIKINLKVSVLLLIASIGGSLLHIASTDYGPSPNEYFSSIDFFSIGATDDSGELYRIAGSYADIIGSSLNSTVYTPYAENTVPLEMEGKVYFLHAAFMSKDFIQSFASKNTDILGTAILVNNKIDLKPRSLVSFNQNSGLSITTSNETWISLVDGKPVDLIIPFEYLALSMGFDDISKSADIALSTILVKSELSEKSVSRALRDLPRHLKMTNDDRLVFGEETTAIAARGFHVNQESIDSIKKERFKRISLALVLFATSLILLLFVSLQRLSDTIYAQSILRSCGDSIFRLAAKYTINNVLINSASLAISVVISYLIIGDSINYLVKFYFIFVAFLITFHVSLWLLFILPSLSTAHDSRSFYSFSSDALTQLSSVSVQIIFIVFGAMLTLSISQFFFKTEYSDNYASLNFLNVEFSEGQIQDPSKIQELFLELNERSRLLSFDLFDNTFSCFRPFSIDETYLKKVKFGNEAKSYNMSVLPVSKNLLRMLKGIKDSDLDRLVNGTVLPSRNLSTLGVISYDTSSVTVNGNFYTLLKSDVNLDFFRLSTTGVALFQIVDECASNYTHYYLGSLSQEIEGRLLNGIGEFTFKPKSFSSAKAEVNEFDLMLIREDLYMWLGLATLTLMLHITIMNYLIKSKKIIAYSRYAMGESPSFFIGNNIALYVVGTIFSCISAWFTILNLVIDYYPTDISGLIFHLMGFSLVGIVIFSFLTFSNRPERVI